jgi:PPK2 family polyphosphate:nucleotide phosphotransferase
MAKKAKQAKKHPKSESVKTDTLSPVRFSDALRVHEGFLLAECDPRSTPAFTGDKAAGEAALLERAGEIGEFQERLYAESKIDGQRSLLLVVQGMDTSGKGGVMRHVVGQMDPQGVKYTAFKAPTTEERKHPFLWRIRNALPRPGQVGVFDRSHYEDVLIVRVHDLVPKATWSRRYAQINDFEAKAAEAGTTIVKVMLHISNDEQKSRLTRRLDRPDKQWKYNPGDVDERLLWPSYQQAYQAAFDKTSTDAAPWHVVPADRKWYARLAVQSLVLEHLEALDPQWPKVEFDVEAEKARLAAT